MKITEVKKATRTQGICRRCKKQIKKGMPYKWVAPYRLPKRIWCADCQPLRSELTGSERLSRVYAASEAIDDATTMDTLQQALRDAVDTANEVRDEYNDSHGEMPDSLQNSERGEEMLERASSLESWADILQVAVDDVEALDDAEWERARELADAANAFLEL